MNGEIIRDNIPKIAGRKGEELDVTLLTEEEHFKQLLLKVIEESHEVFDSEGHPEKIADVLELLMKITRMKGLQWSEIEEIRNSKKEEQGGFETGIFLNY